MSTSKIIKLAGVIKPPARKSEIIEALAIKKREQIITENKKLCKELEDLQAKIQVVARDEALASGKFDMKQSFYVRAQKDHNGRLTVSSFNATYNVEPSPELCAMAKRIYELQYSGIRHEPSLHEVRQQVRAAVNKQTPPDGRVQELLKNPLLESLLEKLDGKPSQALIA